MPRSTVIVFDRYAELIGAQVEEIRGVVRETAHAIEQDVKGRAPITEAGASMDPPAKSARIVTGNLRRSYHTEEHFEGARIEAEVGSDPNIAPYAVYQEYGTSKMAPRPHLTPSSEAQREPFLAKVAAILSGRRFL